MIVKNKAATSRRTPKWLIAFVLAAGEAAAQPAVPPDEVQRTAEEILSSPEFREFQRLREDDAPAGGEGRFDRDWPGRNALPRTRGRPDQNSNQRPHDRERSGDRSSGQQPAESDQDQPYPDGWRGGVEGGRESVRPDAPRTRARASATRDAGAASSTENGAGDGPSSRPSSNAMPRGGSGQSPPPVERSSDDGASPPLARDSDRTANGRGAARAQQTPGGPARPGSDGAAARSDGGGAARRKQDPGAPGENAEERSSRTGNTSRRGSGIRGSNRPFGDGWRGGEQGGRRSAERIAEGRSGDGVQGGRSGATRSRGGSPEGRDGSGRTGSRRAGDDQSSRANRSRGASEPSSPARDSESPALSAAGGPLGSAVASLFHLLAWIFLAGVCGMIAYLIYRAVRDFERAEQPMLAAEGGPAPAALDTDTAPGEVPADVYVARAREFAQAGQYRDAVAQLLLGAMSHIERAGLIRYRRGLTLRDYLRAVRRAKPQFTGMKSMVRVYEPLGFGRRDATREHFETSLVGYEQGFRGGVNGER